MREFKERLQNLIDLKKISQRDLAENLRTNEARISEWLTGKVSKPRRTTIIKIAEYFHCSTDWLADGTGEPFPAPETKTAENVSHLQPYKAAKDADATLAKLMREKFKQQCGTTYFDEFFDFIAEYYGETKEGVDQFFTDVHKTQPNYRTWLMEKKQSGENLQPGGPESLSANRK